MEIILYQSGQNQLPPCATGVFSAPKVQITPELFNLPRPVSATIVISKPSASILKNLSLGLIIGSMVLLSYALSPIFVQELSYRLSSKNTRAIIPESPYKPLFEIADSQKQILVNQEAKKFGVNTNFSLVIPKISAAAKVIPNVNPADEKSYTAALKEGVAHAAGTGFPGNNQTIYLFSHSTNSPLNISRYNAVFYLVKELSVGDEIIIFYIGRKYTYKVVDKFITAGSDVKWLTNPSSQEQLILQTCWPPGTSSKRLIVIARPI